MNFINKYIIKQAAQFRIHKKKIKLTPAIYQRELRKVSIDLRSLLFDSFIINLGIFAATLGLKGFLMPNMFIDGGVTGISMIISKTSHIPLPWLLIIINIPFIIMGFSAVGKQFAIKSLIAIATLALEVYLIDFPPITSDKLLIAVFGGFFLGLGIGLAMRGGAVLDGTEIMAVFLNRKLPITIGGIILIFNVFIFGIAAYIFGIEIAMYAILTYLAASKTVDFVVDGIEEYVGVTIISEKNEEIRKMIISQLGRGCTVYDGKRGYAKQYEDLIETEIIYTLVTRLELSKLQTEIEKIDEKAFVVMNSIKDAKGGMIKKRPLK